MPTGATTTRNLAPALARPDLIARIEPPKVFVRSAVAECSEVEYCQE